MPESDPKKNAAAAGATPFEQRRTSVVIGGAHVMAWLALAMSNLIVAWIVHPPPKRLGVRLLCHAYDTGQLLAAGLTSLFCIVAWRRVVRSRLAGYIALALLAAAIGQVLLDADMRGAPRILGLEAWAVWARVFAAVFSLCIPIGAWIAALSSRGRWRYLVATAAVALAVQHQLILPNLYPGIHAFATWLAAVSLGGAMRPDAKRIWSWLKRRPPLFRQAIAGIVGMFSLWALVWPAPLGVQTLLNQIPGSIVARYKPNLRMPSQGTTGGASTGVWFRNREGLSPLPPSESRLLPKNGIVIVFVVDAMRADALEQPTLAELPQLAKLKARGMSFRHARSTAPATNPSVASIHMGRYPAQIRWSLRSVGRVPRLWPNDERDRLGDILKTASTESMMVVSRRMAGIMPKHGLTSGIQTTTSARSQHAADVVKAFLDWLPNERQEPLFAYLHVSDAHAPYNLGGRKKTPRASYVAELALVDKALGQLVKGLDDKGLEEQTLLMVTADHGEAFGEHNSKYHGSTVYDEMVRVPLLAVGTKVAHAVNDQPVTTLDIAPTVLDLLGTNTPAVMLGQSLVPLLAGKPAQLSRPIFLDSHARMSGMVFDDGFKLVVRRDVPELYNLRTDPKELDNVFESEPTAAERLGAYRKFIKVHKMKFEHL